MKRPTKAQFTMALNALLWLHEVTEDGADRDTISKARFLLDEQGES